MAKVASYAVAVGSDNSFTLSAGSPAGKEFDVNIPQNFDRDQPCILSFMILDVRDIGSMEIKVGINQQVIKTMKYSSDAWEDRAIQEIFEGKQLATGINKVRFMPTGDEGKVVLSDVIVWFQVNV